MRTHLRDVLRCYAAQAFSMRKDWGEAGSGCGERERRYRWLPSKIECNHFVKANRWHLQFNCAVYFLIWNLAPCR
jgi:hypothetical protein